MKKRDLKRKKNIESEEKKISDSSSEGERISDSEVNLTKEEEVRIKNFVEKAVSERDKKKQKIEPRREGRQLKVFKTKEDEKLHTVDSRRFDSLSRLLQGSGTCAAAAFDGDKILIASNVLHNTSKKDKDKNQNQALIVDVMSYLSKIANDKYKDKPIEQTKSTVNILKEVAKTYIGSYSILANVNFKEEIDNLVQYSADNAVDNKWKDLTTLSDKERANAAGIEKRKQSHGGLLGHAPMAIQRLQKDLNNIIHDIEQLKAAERSGTLSEMDKNLLAAFRQSSNHLDVRKNHGPNKKDNAYEETVKNSNLKRIPIAKDSDESASSKGTSYGYELLHINGNKSGKGAHAEMQVAQRLIDKFEDNKKLKTKAASSKRNKTLVKSAVPTASNIYIGVSMLCCLNCHAAIEAVNEVNKSSYADIEKQHGASSKRDIDDNERHYRAPVIQTIIASFNGEVAVDLNTKSYLTLARRGNHDQDFEKNWSAPHFITRIKNPDKSNLLYASAYKTILSELNKKPSPIMYMSDTETSIGEEESERKVGKEEKVKQELIKQLILDRAKEIQDPEILDKTIKELQKQLNQALELQNSKGKEELNLEKQNAFNQYANMSYEYSETDIARISNQIFRNIKTDKIVFGGAHGGTSEDKIALTKDIIRNYINEHIKDKNIEERKPFFAIYNVNGSHWVSYAIEPRENGNIDISYKDSKGHERSEIKDVVQQTVAEAMENVKDIKITVVQLDLGKVGENADQIDGVSCGVFALKNMEIVAKALLEGKSLSSLSNIDSNTGKNSFYNSDHGGDEEKHDKTIKADRKDYAIVFAKETKEQAVRDLIASKAKGLMSEELHTQNEEHIKYLAEQIQNIGNIDAVRIDTSSKEEQNKLGAYSYAIKFDLSEDNVTYQQIEDLQNKVVQIIGGDKEQDYQFEISRERNPEKYTSLVAKIANKLVEQQGVQNASNNMDLPEVEVPLPDEAEVESKVIDELGLDHIELDEEIANRLKAEVGIDKVAYEVNQLVEPFESLINENTNLSQNTERFQGIFLNKRLNNEKKLEILRTFVADNKIFLQKSDKLYNLVVLNDEKEIELKPNALEIIEQLLFALENRKEEKEQEVAYDADISDRSSSPASSLAPDSPNSQSNNLTHSEKYKQNSKLSDAKTNIINQKAKEDISNKDKKIKLNLKEMLNIGNNKEILAKLELYTKIELDKQFTQTDLIFSNQDISDVKGYVNIIPENDHKQDHKFNAKALMLAIKKGEITQDTVICIERKARGENFGMGDVILVSNIIKYNSNPETKAKIIISDEIKSLPIYADSLLYSITKQKGIQLIAVEGKSMKDEKAREQYMANKVVQIASSGKGIILLVGSSHINNIVGVLDERQITSKVITSIEEAIIENNENRSETNKNTATMINAEKPRGRII